jgi:hypothetical protein
MKFFGDVSGAVVRQCAPVRHLPQKCPRNLKNEMPLNKSPKTVFANFLFNELSVFYRNLPGRHCHFTFAIKKGATSAYSINCGL